LPWWFVWDVPHRLGHLNTWCSVVLFR
jgi:hypothetical protein